MSLESANAQTYPHANDNTRTNQCGMHLLDRTHPQQHDYLATRRETINEELKRR